ncbi:MAG: hypothetical protein LBC60_04985 [Spirochaetaceae bacterium]|jgi:hypothetical protein|nr:hypothetical protein [Spirochaetaceae bacterium]
MKKLVAAAFCFVLVWSVTGCSKQIKDILQEIQSAGNSESGDENNVEQSAVRYEDAVAYHNSFLGFSYTVPKGWWLYNLNTENFGEDQEETADPAGLDIYYGDDGDYIDLISFANLQFSNMDNHLGFDINAETVNGVRNISGYMEYFEEFMLEPEEDTTYQLLSSRSTDINGAAYEQRIFEVNKADDTKFNVLTLTREVNGGYFLTIMVSYWPNNKNAETTIINAVAKGT